MRPMFVRNLLVMFIAFLAFQAFHPAAARAGTVHHYEYVLTSGFIYVYDMDNGGALVKTVNVPTGAGVRGAVASAATGMLYISYGSDSNSGGYQLAMNLSTDQVVWTMSYSHGVDSMSISPDGKTIYMPSGELSSGGTWYVEDSSTGNDIGTIVTGGTGPHNTIVSPNGLHVYMGDRDYNLSSSAPGVNDFSIASTATNQIIGVVSPLKSGARPFTINSTETFSFNTLTAFMGYQVGDLSTGKVLYTVTVDGSHIPGYTTQTPATIPTHGISISPDDKELYLVDQPNSYVHVFDLTGLPAGPPVQVADIPLVNQMTGNQTQCPYDCLRDGWVQHSRDGRFVNVGDSGDVIDTLSRTTVATLPMMLNSRVEIEIDFQDSTPIWAATSRSGVGYANPAPPTFTARITSPVLGSTVSGANVAVTTSVIDSVSIASVDLYVDGTLNASTTTSPYSFSWDSTKNANGTHTLMITANDTAGNTTSFSATFTVNNTNIPNPPSITTTSLPAGKQKIAYAATLAATGGTTPYSWSIVSGALPAGLTLAPSTGAISGTPTGSGSNSFSVQVSDANSQTATKPLSIAVSAAPSQPSITTTSLPAGKQKVAYTSTLVATGGTTPYTWSILSGSLPAGLALAPTTGAISGTPTGSGTSSLTVEVSDANSQTATMALSLAVSAAPIITPPSITTTSLPGGTQKVAYAAALAATGGTTPYAWSIISASLPAGLALSSSTGAISGTPTGSGTSSFTVQVSDANSQTVSKTFSLAVSAAPIITPPSITTTSLPGGTQKVAYAATLVATGGTAPYTWSVISGSLPVGLSLAPTTGRISGTPTASGSSSFTVRVSDSKSSTATKSLSVTVAATGAPSIVATSGTPQSAAIGTAFATTLKATVRDGSGQLLAGATVTFAAPAQSGPSGTFAGGLNTATTNASGVATSAVFTANSIAGGPYNVTASVAGAATPAIFSLTNDARMPSSIKATAGTPQHSLIDSSLSTALKATVTDAGGSPMPDVTVIFTAPSSGPSGTFVGGGATTMATTDASGVATAPAFTTNGITGGPYSVTATVAGVAAPATFSLSNIDFTVSQPASGTVQLTAGTASKVALTVATTPSGSSLPSDVNFSCVIPGATSNTTCSLTPAKISANSPSGSSTTLVLSTSANLPPSSQPKNPRAPYLPMAAMAALTSLLAIYLLSSRGLVPLRGRTVYATLALLAISSAGLMGCVGLNSAQPNPSSVTVTAISGGVSKILTVPISIK